MDEIILDITATTLRQTLKSRFENSSIYSNALTNLPEKRLVFLKKALKGVSKTLAEAVSELWTERSAAMKLIEQTKQDQSELDQQKLRGTPLPSNQQTMESFWKSPTPTSPTTTTTSTSNSPSRIKNKTTTD